MRMNHVRQHSFGLCLILLATQTAAAPGNLFPYKNAQFIAKRKNNVRLLVMSQPDKIHSHFFHERHFRPHLFFCHSCAYARMVFVAVCTAQQKAGTVEAEWSFFHKFKMAESESLDGFLLLSVVVQGNFAGVKSRILVRP